MSIDIDCRCDECGKKIDTGEVFFCEDCISVLKDRIEELEKEVEALDAEIRQMEKG